MGRRRSGESETISIFDAFASEVVTELRVFMITIVVIPGAVAIFETFTADLDEKRV